MERTAHLGERASGILLHPTSLPGPFGAGDLGPAARAFADWLAASGQTWWQMLPVVPPGFGASPYDSPSSFAGSPWLVSLEDLAAEGLLQRDEMVVPPDPTPERARHADSQKLRESRLRLAVERCRARASSEDRAELERLRENEPWLDGWALFSALTRGFGGASWTEWPEPLRKRDPGALDRARREHQGEIAFHEHVQLWFRRQWRRLREHCNEQGIALLGDVPMFVAHDSADVWCNPELFFLDDRGRRTVVAGVPPDVFSETGQLWGNPLYRWERMKQEGFGWWLERLGVTLARFDAVRLDHFIGFRRYWEIAVDAKDARVGRFVAVPGEDFFETARNAFSGLPFIAEDLGLVTEEVHALRDRFGLPGMRVLQFAFGNEPSEYLPHRYVRNTVVYTGTHDNDTTVGWFAKIPQEERTRVLRYIGSDGRQIHHDLVRTALASVANLALFPLQDAVGIGSEGRMNTPATVEDNWAWRARAAELTPELGEQLRSLSGLFERTPRWHTGDGAAFARLY